MRSYLSLYGLFAVFLLHGLVTAQQPQPVSVGFGPQFLGYDGSWSAVYVRAGTPEQWLSLLPSTLSSETWLAGENYCTSGDQTCSTLRGGIFRNGSSSTWRSLGRFEMGYSEFLQQNPTAEYGFDVLGISDALAPSGQIIALVDDIDHWIGSFGLNVQNTQISGNNNTLPFLSSLVQNLSAIPSHSYGYTAGAAYHAGGVAGSLTLGGVDTSRYDDGGVGFALSSGYTPTVTLRRIQVAASSGTQTWAETPLELMAESQAATFVIDSSTPYLWLPETVCNNFANALNLTWNSTINLYTFGNATTLSTLLSQNLTFTFTISGVSESAALRELSVSLNAFNLQLSYPFPNLFTQYTDERVNYFPLRRTNNPQQYTIGRAFLQEIYLTVDYERNSFSLNQAILPSSNTQTPQLAAIVRPNNSTWPGPTNPGSKGLSTAAMAGIAIGVIALVVIAIGLAVFWCIRRRRRSSETIHDDKSGLLSIFSKRSTITSKEAESAAELQADKHHPTELISDKTNTKFEMSAETPHEMAGAEVPPSFYQERVNAQISQRNDPRAPIELVQPPSRSSISKEPFDADVEVSRQPPAPAYSPAELNQRYSNSLSPTSHRHHSNPFSNSSDHIISPITGSGSERDESNTTHRSNAGSHSSHVMSPVSPATARGDARFSDGGSKDGSTGRLSVQNKASPYSTLSPNSAVQSIRRSPSRDSRFKEDLSESSDSRTKHQNYGSVKSNANSEERFSWE